MEEMRIQFDAGDGLKIGSAAQFLTETAVRLIEAMGYYRNEVEAPADEGSGDRIAAIRAALEASWAGTQRALSELAYVMRMDPQEVMDQFEKDLLAFSEHANDND